MRQGSFVAAVIAALLILNALIPSVASRQLVVGAIQPAQQPLKDISDAWPAIAIAVLAAIVVGALLGIFDVGAAGMMLLLAAIALLVYAFYWRHLSQTFPFK